MICEICGAPKWWEQVDGSRWAYCPRCEPRSATILGPEDSSEFDIEDPGLGIVGPCPSSQYPVNSAIAMTGTSSPTTISFPNPSRGMKFEAGGVPIMQIFEKDFPKTAEVGALGYVEGSSAAHIFDGEEWINLGESLAKLKVSKKNLKCDRRAAVAATKKKNSE